MKTHNTIPISFNYGDQVVRSITLENEPWFVGKDVCQTLGIINHNKSLQTLDPDERRGYPMVTPSGKQNTIIINESGVYHLIFRSNKPEANQFRKWVTSEVLPAIRQQGKYDPIAQREVLLKDERLKYWQTISNIRVKVKAINEELELIASNKTYSCDECGKVMKSANALAGHIRGAHGGGKENLKYYLSKKECTTKSRGVDQDT